MMTMPLACSHAWMGTRQEHALNLERLTASVIRHFGILPCLIGASGVRVGKAFRASANRDATNVRPQKTHTCRVALSVTSAPVTESGGHSISLDAIEIAAQASLSIEGLELWQTHR